MSGVPRVIRITNISDAPCTVDRLTAIGFWLSHGIPRSPGYVSVGSRRSKSWEMLAYEATDEETLTIREEWRRERLEEEMPPCVERKEYTTPTRILKRGNRLEPSREQKETMVSIVSKDSADLELERMFDLESLSEISDEKSDEDNENDSMLHTILSVKRVEDLKLEKRKYSSMAPEVKEGSKLYAEDLKQ